MEIFYTQLAEWSKFIFYVVLSLMVFIGLWKKSKKESNWANWIHAAIFIHFIVGAFYSGIRMLTTNPETDMLIRRIFAIEAWVNFAFAAFYFLLLEFISYLKSKK